MAFYDYYCEANGRTVEVQHPMDVRLETWGEVCAKAWINAGDTPLDAPVIRLIAGVTPMEFRVKGLDKDEPSTKLEF